MSARRTHRRWALPTPLTIVTALAGLLVCRTIAVTWLSYRDYFPPNFRADFLLGRQQHFFGAYQWAFYAHIIAGPLALASGLALMSESLRQRFPAGHRRLGRALVLGVLLVVAPSGLWMARYAATGAVAGIAFATLAIATAFCAAQGWRCAVRRQFAKHRRWMRRCFALLCSAEVLRVFGGLAEVLGVAGAYAWAAWLSWLLPLAFVELWARFQKSAESISSPPATVSMALRVANSTLADNTIVRPSANAARKMPG